MVLYVLSYFVPNRLASHSRHNLLVHFVCRVYYYDENGSCIPGIHSLSTYQVLRKNTSSTSTMQTLGFEEQQCW